jgi:hypothetical protein
MTTIHVASHAPFGINNACGGRLTDWDPYLDIYSVGGAPVVTQSSATLFIDTAKLSPEVKQVSNNNNNLYTHARRGTV